MTDVTWWSTARIATLSHPHRVRVSFYFGEVSEVLHERRESGVSVLDLHQKWKDEGCFPSLLNHLYDVNIAVIPLLFVLSHGSKLFYFCYFCGYFRVIFYSFDPWCFGEFLKHQERRLEGG